MVRLRGCIEIPQSEAKVIQLITYAGAQDLKFTSSYAGQS
ncbi:hypothetical protein ALT721_2200012 [Alteromonas alvinellae]